MKHKNANLIVSSLTFVLGVLFVVSDNVSFTGNVIGASGDPGATLASIIGMFMIMASGVFFIMTLSMDHLELERLVHKNDHNSSEIKNYTNMHEQEEETVEEHK